MSKIHFYFIKLFSLAFMQDKVDILNSQNTVLLDIPPRFQWENGHGFCGETSIQSCSLYFGNYISQEIVRKIGRSQILIGQNDEQTIRKLGYQFQTWNIESPKPQYKDHLQWIKKNIEKGYPVIITGYCKSQKNQGYDHIYLAVGVNSTNFSHYSEDDVLIYTDHFSEEYTITPFGKVWDSRSMSANGKDLDFALPKNVNYGIAIKGIIDKNEQFYPIRIKLEDDHQPNVSIGQESTEFQLNITISDLTPGKKYALLRYNNYKNLPIDNIDLKKAEKVIKFTANGSKHNLSQTVDSHSMIFYRCVDEEDLE